MLLSYYRECIRESLSLSWGAANSFFGALVAVVMPYLWHITFVPESSSVPNGVIAFLFYFAVAFGAACIFVFFFIAPFRVWRKERVAKLATEATISASHLRLSYASDKTVARNGQRMTFLRVTNSSEKDVAAQVRIIESFFQKEGSNAWEATSIVSRVNMSWGHLPDGHPEKYSTTQIAPGSELIDFISGPGTFQTTINGVIGPHMGFVIKIDPKHRGVNPIFSEPGQYKFAIQASASTEKPADLEMTVRWDGADFLIRSNKFNSILETHS